MAKQLEPQSNRWVRCRLTAKLCSDAHLGSGSGGSGIDALVARDRNDRPVIWASHLEGVLRDAARRLHGDTAAARFFGRVGGEQQRAVFTSLYAKDSPECHIWRSTARAAFDRAPQDDTLRVIEYVASGTEFVGEVELPSEQLKTLERLVQEVDALGSGRAAGAGQVKLCLDDATRSSPSMGETGTGRLVLLLKNRDPLCITATATPDNLIPSLAFVPGRTLLGAIAAWLIAEGARETASLLTTGKVSVSDALPLPQKPVQLDTVEVLPAPLSLKSLQAQDSATELPWWALPSSPTKRIDAWAQGEAKLKRPEDDLFVYRENANPEWTAFRPARRVRLRNRRPSPNQPEPSLFAIEQLAEESYFLAELHGSSEDMERLAKKLAPVLEARRWLRVGRAGAPVEVAQHAWLNATSSTKHGDKVWLILTSDLLVRDGLLRWRTALNEDALREVVGESLSIVTTERAEPKEMQDSVMVHGFNGTSRLWRMPASAIRRGSVFEISGAGVAKLAERAANQEWLGERTHEGFGRFRLEASLPGVTLNDLMLSGATPGADLAEETIAASTQQWFENHKALVEVNKADKNGWKPPSLSQWLDLISELDSSSYNNTIGSRLNPTTAGGRCWKHRDAKAILEKLNGLQADQQLHARLFVRWLRAGMREKVASEQHRQNTRTRFDECSGGANPTSREAL